MYRTGDTELLNSNEGNLPAVGLERRALLSLSWYSSVPEAGAHQTLSRVSAPRNGGGPGFSSRVWIASRRQSADPRSAWHTAHGNGSVVRFTRADVGPRRESYGCGLHLGTSLEHQGSRMLIALHSPQDPHGPAGSGHASDSGMLGTVEFFEVLVQDRLMSNQRDDSCHQGPTQWRCPRA